jgi:REP element-mobilizing transposase RayT
MWTNFDFQGLIWVPSLSMKCIVLRFVVTGTRLHGLITLKTTMKVSDAVRNLNHVS